MVVLEQVGQLPLTFRGLGQAFSDWCCCFCRITFKRRITRLVWWLFALSVHFWWCWKHARYFHHSPAIVLLILHPGYLYLVVSVLLLLPMGILIQDRYWKGHLGFVWIQLDMVFFELLNSLLCWVHLNINVFLKKKISSVAYFLYTFVSCTVSLMCQLCCQFYYHIIGTIKMLGQ